MLRASKALGDGSSLLPFDVNYVEDLPHDLALVISHGLAILNWQENLPPDEMPPTWMWIFADELDKWFDAVKQNRAEKYNIQSGEKVDYSGPGFMGNELATEFKRR